jgi:hypothetical protein
VLQIAGEREIVFDWTVDRCEDNDIPDLPARAFRDAEGQTQLLAGHYTVYRSLGPDLDHVTRDCAAVMRSDFEADPALYNDHEWIAGVHTEDGQTIYAVLHNEYQGHTHAGQCPSGDYFNCWYNALTLAVSTDGGASYADAAPPPGHLVATLPYQYEGAAGPYGIFEGSNIIKGADGLYYQFIRIDDYRSPEQWICLMRTDTLADPRAWMAWDGEGFNLPFVNPYQQAFDDPREHLCAPISPHEIGTMHESITYNTYLDRYVLVGTTADTINGREVWGIFYAFSTDLIHWSHRQLLLETELTWTYQTGDDDPVAYPTLLDPDSPSRNYETTDQRAYLYLTQFNYQAGQMTLDRDLIRVPVQFFRSEAAAQHPEAVTSLSLDVQISDETIHLSGDLTDANNAPLADAPIEFSATPLDDSALAVSLTGTVPDGTTRALVGFRVNTECGCAGPSDFALYSTSYVEGDETHNRVPNPAFQNGLAQWGAWGSAESSLLTGDRSNLHVTAQADQDAAINSEVFPATAGAPYTVTFVAKVMPGSAGSGYFTLIFLDSRGEITRQQLPLTHNVTVLGRTTTDENGQYEFVPGETIPAPYQIEARYAGDATHLPFLQRVIID